MSLINGTNIDKIMRKFNLSKSTIYYIINKNKYWIQSEKLLGNIYEDIFGFNLHEMNEIINILKPPKEPLTIKDVQNKLESWINRKINKTMITKFIKSRLNYSFKKGSSTTKRGTTLQIKIQQSVFSSRIIKEFLNGKYIVNIDESSFNKDIKMQYGWLPKGITSAIINQIHQGSKSMLTALWSDGEYIWAVINYTVNSQCFQDFFMSN